MKIKCLLAFCVVLSACAKDPKVENPNFVVSLNSTEIQKDKEVTFDIKSDAGLITFYSGEIGHDYNFKDGRIVEKGDVTLAFTNALATSGNQPKQFSVQVSSNFNGVFDIENVKAANWIDITDNVALAAAGASVNTSVSLTNLMINGKETNLVEDGKPLYVAFKYITEIQRGSANKQRIWTVTNFLLKSNTSIGLVNLGDQSNSGFQLVNEGQVESGRSVISAGKIELKGNAVNTEVRTETWAISKAFSAGRADLGPDKGVAIKSYLDVPLNNFPYKYAAPGNYTATFVAANSTIYGSKQIIKTVDIVVKP